MVHAMVRAKRVGGSIMVRIPKEIIETEGIREEEIVDIEVKKARKNFFGCMPGLSPFDKKEDRLRSRYE